MRDLAEFRYACAMCARVRVHGCVSTFEEHNLLHLECHLHRELPRNLSLLDLVDFW